MGSGRSGGIGLRRERGRPRESCLARAGVIRYDGIDTTNSAGVVDGIGYNAGRFGKGATGYIGSWLEKSWAVNRWRAESSSELRLRL